MKRAESDVEVFIFDPFGVITLFDNDIVYSRLAQHCADPDDAFRRLDGLMSGPDLIIGELTLHQMHRRLVGAHGLSLAYPEFEAAWLEPYSEPMPGMADLVTTLSKHYRLLLLSNVDRYYWKVVRAMQLRYDQENVLTRVGENKHSATLWLSYCAFASGVIARCGCASAGAASARKFP